MPKTISELIASAIGEAEADDVQVEEKVEPRKAPAAKGAAPPSDETEKLASALEFIGRRGVESFLKAASHPAGMGNVGASKSETNGGTVDLGTTGTGDHHPALASNRAAIDAKKTVKAQHESPQLKKALDTTPYADPVPKQKLDHAAAGGDKNINKSASANDAELIRQALAKKVAEARAGGVA
jgi:hypothetical protein